LSHDGQTSAQGVTWHLASRTLTVEAPSGSPRVLTSTRYIVPRLNTTTTNSCSSSGGTDIDSDTGFSWSPNRQAQQQQQQQRPSNAAGSCKQHVQALVKLLYWAVAIAVAVVAAAA